MSIKDRLEAELAEADAKAAVVPEPEVEAAASVETPAPTETTITTEEDTSGEDLLKKFKEEGDKLKQRKKELERGLNETARERNELKEELDRIRQELESVKSLKHVETQTQSIDWEGFDDIGQKVMQSQSQLKAELQAQVNEAKRMLEEERKRSQDLLLKAKAEEHYQKVASVHNDAADYFNPDNDKHAVLMGWAQFQAPEYATAADNPLSMSAEFVSRMLTELKRDIGATKAKAKPALGDIAVAKDGSSKPANKVAADVFTNDELRNLDSMIAQNRKNPEALKQIMEKLERTEKTLT